MVDQVTGGNRPEIVQWMRLVLLLADGSKALARAGRWSEALHHAEQHHGVEELLYEGCQVSIIARATAGPHDQAAYLLDSTPEGPWEKGETSA